MKNRLYVVLLLTVLTAGAMSILVLSSRKTMETKHGFTRKFSNNKVRLLHAAVVPHKLFVAGNSDSLIYFHSDNPAFVTYADTGLHHLGTIPLPVDSISQQLAGGFSMSVHYPDVLLYGYNMASILKYDISQKQQTIIPTPGNFTNAVRVNDSIFILKYFTGDNIDQAFCLLNSYTGTYQTDSFLTEHDLSASGSLLYDQPHARCLYVHQFSNNITIFDTALHTLPNAHTVDTFTQNHGQYISHTKSGSDDVLYKPKGDRMLINYLSHVYEGRLYVNSLITADNETILTEQRETVIDVYDTNTGKYLESFYVPLGNSKKLSSFRVTGQRLIVTYKDRIAIYEIP